MAGSAAKKASSRTKSVLLRFGGVALACTALYAAVRVFVHGDAALPGLLAMIGHAIILCMYAASVAGMYVSAQNDLAAETSFDVFAVAAATQVLLCFTSWAWYLLLLPPGYGAFVAGRALWGQISQLRMAAELAKTLDAGKKGAMSAEEAEEDQKRRAKRSHGNPQAQQRVKFQR